MTTVRLTCPCGHTREHPLSEPVPNGANGKSRVGERARVKLLDMGLARVITPEGQDSEPGVTEAGVFLGTPDYASPEQAEGPGRADARSDLYSLGGTLYFLLTGESRSRPHARREEAQGDGGTSPSPAAKRPEVPQALDALVRRMLAREPADRYQTASEVVAALDRLPRPDGSATRRTPATDPATGPRPRLHPCPRTSSTGSGRRWPG